MNTLEAIQTRRSIRQYADKAIASKELHEIIAAAMMAPSANNQQPWHFVVIDDSSLMNKIIDISPHAYMCMKAPASILVCGNIEAIPSPEFWPQDCAAATQNLLLAAHEKGLGAVWTGVYPKKSIVKGFKALLKLPKEIYPFAYIVLGYPAEKPESKGRFNKKRIHHNVW